MLTALNVKNALNRLGVCEGDSIITHSSFKSLGATENGAATVIEGIQSALGERGTVIFPTLCQRDWEHVYENWSIDAPSAVGYLTEYFRKLPDAKRSNQATHSVAAIGKMADYITESHGNTGKRYGIFGDTPFSADSPWEKMYNIDTKVLLIGVEFKKCTFRHYVEYCYMEKELSKLEGSPKYKEMKDRVWTYMKSGAWPHVNSEYVAKTLEAEGKLKRTVCGNAELVLFSSRDFVNRAYELLESRHPDVFWTDGDLWKVSDTIEWLEEVENLERR